MKEMSEKGKGDMSFNFPICNECKHHIDGATCLAFDRIPDSIILGKNDHKKPLPGQKNDLVFEPINKKY